MAQTFEVEVVAADHQIFAGDLISMVVPGIDGYFGVLAGHAPLVAALSIGELTMTPPDGKTAMILAVSGGFIEVTPGHVLVLADAAELAEEIDVERARQAVDRAQERLAGARGGSEIDYDRAQAALIRAINRLRVAGANQ